MHGFGGLSPTKIPELVLMEESGQCKSMCLVPRSSALGVGSVVWGVGFVVDGG